MTNDFDPYDLSLATLHRRYAAEELTPADVVRGVYRRIHARGADGTWISLADEAAALAAAERLGRSGAREDLPLYGVPFAVKDNIDVAGLPTTAACPDFSYTPDASAPAVARLVEAGAICIGKTNLDQFATGLSGVRSPYGACASIFNPAYAAGGSSSGSAVAVGAGLVSFALGTDTGGSGRIPAGYNNIVGVKPTLGWISLRGVVPNCRTLDTVSVFALSCADGLAVTRLMAGFDPDDPFSRLPTMPMRGVAQGMDGLRFGVPGPGDREFFGDAAAAALFDEAIARVQALGGAVVEIDFAPFVEAGRLMFEGPWVAERVAGLADFVEARPDALLPVTRAVFETARRWSAADAFRHLYRRQALKRMTEVAIWPQIDMLLVPTTATAQTIVDLEADPIARNNRNGYYSYFVNLLDLCAVAVPNGFLPGSGVAMGVTLIAPAWHDDAVARIAGRYHEASGLLPGLAAMAPPTGGEMSAG